ncbi:MAG: metallophosphoesterase [Ruminococcus flavefaciens]|nr:metallophosphoesterase [Ruminococcus flavefaciens]
MRIIVISDTHGKYDAIETVFFRNADADWFIHLGDGERELDQFITSNPAFARKIIHVAGNCDYNSLSHDSFILPAAYCNIFITHGHHYNVKSSLEPLKKTAIQNGCNIALYGHTHSRFMSYEDGLYIMNPGSASCPRDGKAPSFGHIDISVSGVVMNIAEVAPLK